MIEQRSRSSGLMAQNTLGPAASQTKPSGRNSGLLRRLSRWLERHPQPAAYDLQALYLNSLKDESANRLARQWMDTYSQANEDEKRSLLAALVHTGANIDVSADIETKLFRRLYAQSNSLEQLVELRADMLRWRNQIAGLSSLEQMLASSLSNWFDVGMLELRPINWDSPASLLEKLIHYEAVHEIRSWEDMRRRVAADRRCYAFFHPRMNDIPLIFVEVALAQQMEHNVQTLLDPSQPIDAATNARWAIFYSISSTQPGLRGISFGNFLLKRVIEELNRELPKLKSFATLSPIPGFVKWLEKQTSEDISALLRNRPDQHREDLTGAQWTELLRTTIRSKEPSESVKRSALRLAARYLATMQHHQPIDPVARFHLDNGARIERLNWLADVSAKGLAQSCGMMVNYLYAPNQLDHNRAQLEAGNPATARSVQKL